MINGIRQSDCKFYVDKEARTVICVIPNTRDMLVDYIWERFHMYNFSDKVGFKAGHDYEEEHLRLPKSFRGKAVCAPEDEWNEETGRMVAFARAKNKAYSSFFRHANAFIQDMDNQLNHMITDFNDFGMRLEARRDQLENEIEKRTR